MELTPIAKVIKEKGLRKGWVAEKAEVAPGTLSMIISGKSKPTIEVAIRLGRVLDKSVEELFGHLVP